MYANEEDVYGDELEGDEDKNDGLNALVKIYLSYTKYRIFNG
jgi:hypothetical protein